MIQYAPPEIPTFAKKLNLVIGKEFKIERNGTIEPNTTYKYTAHGLVVKHRDKGDWWEAFPQIIRELEEGSAVIVVN